MIKKFYKVAIIMLGVLQLAGCWDSLDIEKHDIVITVVIDYKDDKYYSYTEIAAIMGGSGNGQGNQTQFEVLNSQGETLISARDELNRRSDRPIYLGGTRAVVFTDNYAKNGIEEYLNRMRGDIYYRKPIFLVTSSTEPEKLLKDRPENAPSIGNSIENTLDSLYKEGTGCSVTAGNVLEALAVKSVGFFLPDVNIEQKESTVTGYSVFKDAKKIGSIDAKDRNGLVLLHCNKAELLYMIEYKGRQITIRAVMSKKTIKPRMQKGKVYFTADFDIAATVEYIDKMVRFTKKDQDNIMRLLENRINSDIQKAVSTSQKEYQCDYLHFYKYFRAYKPKEFRTINWNSVYSQAAVDINVKAKLKETGLLEIMKT